jgi:hypothetical protein
MRVEIRSWFKMGGWIPWEEGIPRWSLWRCGALAHRSCTVYLSRINIFHSHKGSFPNEYGARSRRTSILAFKAQQFSNSGPNIPTRRSDSVIEWAWTNSSLLTLCYPLQRRRLRPSTQSMRQRTTERIGKENCTGEGWGRANKKWPSRRREEHRWCSPKGQIPHFSRPANR